MQHSICLRGYVGRLKDKNYSNLQTQAAAPTKEQRPVLTLGCTVYRKLIELIGSLWFTAVYS